MKTEDNKEISLRDYFAAKAMQSFAGVSDGFTGHECQIDLLTRHAYLWADAMLKARDEARQ